MTFFGTTEHFSGRIGALRWSILVGKQKHHVQKPKGRPFNSWGRGGGVILKKKNSWKRLLEEKNCMQHK